MLHGEPVTVQDCHLRQSVTSVLSEKQQPQHGVTRSVTVQDLQEAECWALRSIDSRSTMTTQCPRFGTELNSGVSKPDLAETSGSSSGNSTETLVAVAAGTALAATGAALWRAWVTSDKEAAADAAAAKNCLDPQILVSS